MKRYIKKLHRIWKLVLLFILVAMAFSYAMFQGGFVSWFLFYSFLPFALYGLLVALYPIREFQVNRKIEKYEYSAKESMKVEITLKRRSVFPVFYLIVEDLIAPTIQRYAQEKKIMMLGFKRNLTFSYEIKELPRGEHRFSQIALRIGDPLGLIEKEKIFIQEDTIIVYPPFEELIYKPLENHYDQGMTSSRERVQRDTTMAVGIREYQPGDRFSWINWKASAKRDSMMTKEFEQRQSHDMLVIMDCLENKRFEAVVSFTASLVRGIIKKGAQVGFLSVEKEKTVFPIRGGETHQQLIFYHLAKVQSTTDRAFDQVIENESGSLQQHATLMLVTSILTRDLMEKVSFLASKRFNLVLFVVKEANEKLSKEERVISSFATKRGVRVIPVSLGNFKEAFGEVAAG